MQTVNPALIVTSSTGKIHAEIVFVVEVSYFPFIFTIY